MENKTDYEKAKAEAWAEFYDEELKDRPQWEPISDKKVFDYAFESAYRYGRFVGMEEAKTQSESEPAHIPEAGKKVDRNMIASMAMQGFLSSNSAIEQPKFIAEAAVEYADALIAELKKEAK